MALDPSTLLAMSHEGSAILSMRSTLEIAAGLAVAESHNGGVKIIRWRNLPNEASAER